MRRRWRWGGHNLRMHSRSWWVWAIRNYADRWTHRYWWRTMFGVSGCLPRLRRSRGREAWSSFWARAYACEATLGSNSPRIAMITACPVWWYTPRPMSSVSACTRIIAVPAATSTMTTSVVMQTTERRSLLHFILFLKPQIFASRSRFGDFLGHFPIKGQF